MATPPAATENYKEAARRHAPDALLLLNSGRHVNASHLAGLAAECALKAILVAHGVHPLVQTQYMLHVNLLWPQYESWARGRSLARFLPIAASSVSPLFDGWSIHQRYHDGAAITPAVAHAHYADLRACLMALQNAELDGAFS